MSTIPASALVNVTPGVIGAGGSAIDLNGLMLTTSSRVPIGTVPSFPSAQAVGEYFGPSSGEKALADVYFEGFEGSDAKPGALLMAQFNTTAVAAYLRGGNVGAALTLAELQALPVGSVVVVMDGYTHTGASIDLSAASSFSSAASIISAAVNSSQPVIGTYTAAIASTTLTVSAVLTGGPLAIGQTLSGSGVTANTKITAFLSGTGGTGTYTVDISQTAASTTITASATPIVVAYDSQSGGFLFTSGITGAPSTAAYATGTLADDLLLRLADGAVISQGAAIATPEAFMDGVIAVTQNWASFMSVFDPDVSGFDNKLAFAEWADAQGDRYAYVCWDTDVSPTAAAPATGSLGYAIEQAELSGTFLMHALDASIAAFVCGVGASLDFAVANGRTTYAYRRQSGLVAAVTTEAAAANLLANGYNFYGAYGTANDEFTFLQDGSVSGDFLWMDSFVNQIWMNNSFQLALISMMQNIRSIPYNQAGNSIIEAALADPIVAAGNFGVYRAGVALSASQKSQVNTQAGTVIAPTLEQRGWYLQILPADATARVERSSPPCKFWYVDGESVQSIDLSSINVL